MNLASRTLNTIGPDAVESPTGLGRDGRSRDEAPGTLHLFTWQMVGITWPGRERSYYFAVGARPSLAWLLRSAFDRMIDVVREVTSRVQRLIEADRTRLLGLVGREVYFAPVHVRVSDTFGRIDVVAKVRRVAAGPNAAAEVDARPAEADQPGGFAPGRPEPTPPDLPRILSAGGKSALHSPLN